LWINGERNDDKREFDHILWFTDIDVRAADGW
jgi:hypothetical protein